jgi:hypothetical protein
MVERGKRLEAAQAGGKAPAPATRCPDCNFPNPQPPAGMERFRCDACESPMPAPVSESSSLRAEGEEQKTKDDGLLGNAAGANATDERL